MGKTVRKWQWDENSKDVMASGYAQIGIQLAVSPYGRVQPSAETTEGIKGKNMNEFNRH